MSDLANISRMVDDIEIHKAFCDMNPTKAPGIDGLHAAFYQSQWSNVGRSVCSFIKEIFAGKEVPHEINKTLLVLIPKKENPESLKLFRPISIGCYHLDSPLVELNSILYDDYRGIAFLRSVLV